MTDRQTVSAAAAPFHGGVTANGGEGVSFLGRPLANRSPFRRVTFRAAGHRSRVGPHLLRPRPVLFRKAKA